MSGSRRICLPTFAIWQWGTVGPGGRIGLGASRAGSSTSGRFVAAITMTPFSDSCHKPVHFDKELIEGLFDARR